MDTPVSSQNLAAETAALVQRTRATFDRGITRPYEWRRAQLEAIERMLVDKRAEILAALNADLGKSELEGMTAEVSYVGQEVSRTLKSLRKWMRPEGVRTSMIAQPGRSAIHREPLGVVLIIAPWNFPFQLVFAPLVGAIAAGNCVVIKPSELASNTSKLIAALVQEYLDNDAIAVVEGGVAETTALLEQRFDHILFTGSPRVGRIVMTAAARHLTPVTLELGGKSPVIVDRSAKLELAARRIVWGKFTNAGQICLAPDYVMIDEQVYEPMVELLAKTIREFYGDEPKASPDYGRIISADHVRRLAVMLEGEDIVVGGEVDEAERFIAPTLIRDVAEDSALMQSEIFGPLLPVMPIANLDAAVARINARPKPLALYMFADDRAAADTVLARTSSGAAVVNHAWIHAGVHTLPFGGVGESGMGCYHGHYSFETFSHAKSVVRKPSIVDPDMLYPPYTESKQKWILRLL